MFFCLLPVTGNAEAEKNKVRIGYLQSDIHQLACWVPWKKDFTEKTA